MRIPRATYRVQLTRDFPLRAAREILPYLERLGVSDLYVSPILQARPGSTHGYDVIDPLTVNPELGGRAQLDGLLDDLAGRGLGLLVDIVPNHMAFDGGNRMLADVLENGPESRYFGFFDVEWDHPYEGMKGRLLAPFLGDFYGTCLERGELRLVYDREGFSVSYYSLRLPLRIESYTRVLTQGRAELRRQLGRGHPEYLKYLGLLYLLRHLPPGSDPGERYDQIAFAKSMLWELHTGSPEVRRVVDTSLEHFNGRPEDPTSFDDLDALLQEQHFRLAFWKVGTEELNYRRFFSINELISLRAEEEEVFNHTHALVLELAGGSGEVRVGLRVDHVDGLYDPHLYLKRLRERLPEGFMVVEKILQAGERLPESWPVQGTTGYDFLNVANGLFCSRRNRLTLGRIYRRFAGGEVSFLGLVEEKKRLIAEKHMVGDIDNLARLLKRLAGRYRYGSDFTLHGFKRALGEMLALFPVYRTYIAPGRSSDADLALIAEVVRRSKQNLPDFVHELAFIEKVFALRFEAELPPEEQRRWLQFIQRFQQFTGPLMAKGLEDTALYVHNRLLSLNDVGGNPDRFGSSAIEFHHFNRIRGRAWPHTLNATATHDTKRGEDVRARLNVLSELPLEWEHQVGTWRRLNRRHRAAGVEAPDGNDEYFLYQTLVGAWPFRAQEVPEFKSRLKAYLIKAVREAKVHTAWLAPDQGYERGFLEFVEGMLVGAEAPSDGGSGRNPFLEHLLPFQRRVAWFGILNSLSQTLLKMTCPGIPDFYQGTELWDLSLVDPDNRRPVDYVLRARLLERILAEGARDPEGLIPSLFAAPEDGAVKLYLIQRILGARNREHALFASGAYRPLRVRGERKNHVVAFARARGRRTALVAAPRFFTTLAPERELPLGGRVWGDTRIELPESLHAGGWTDTVSGCAVAGGATLMAAELFARFPGALLLDDGPGVNILE
ncbi:MAG: malto-oligosyltrehalose synthase [Spirochaetales bacterium]|nr:malto-oligosyltrehalose synthase [Spirochaetales bacterium]